MDPLTPTQRSRVMASVRSRDTRPELAIRSALHRRGFRFRVDARDLPGRPDLKLTRHRAVVFVHGCFWHGHDCAHFRLPASNIRYWRAKITRNRERDRRVVAELLDEGWRVAVIWECALSGPGFRNDTESLIDSLAVWINGRRRFVEFYDRLAKGEKMGARHAYARNENLSLFVAERTTVNRGSLAGN